MSFIRTGFREITLKLKRQKTRIALRHDRRLLQRSEINLGREGTAEAANFPELRNEIVALKKLEQEQKEVALRIARIDEGIKRIEEERQQIVREQANAIAKFEAEKKPLLQKRNQAKSTAEVSERELASVERRIQESEAADRNLLKQLSDLHALDPAPPDLEALSAGIMAKRAHLPDDRAELVRARMSMFYCINICTKLAIGGLSGFEYVAILAGETRSPARDIGRSVIIASPVIALAFILGTSSVLAFIGDKPIDLIGPVPQTLRLGLRFFPIAGGIASIAIILMTVKTIASTSVHVTGSSRLPMVAGWDCLLPRGFSHLHPKFKTPINSVIFVSALTLTIAIASQIGAGIQEAFQLVDNAGNVFYGIVYFTMFAIPIFGAAAIRSHAPIWLRVAAICGAAVSLSAIVFTIYPIIDVPSPLSFAAKIIVVTAIANAIGVAIYLAGKKRQGA